MAPRFPVRIRSAVALCRWAKSSSSSAGGVDVDDFRFCCFLTFLRLSLSRLIKSLVVVARRRLEKKVVVVFGGRFFGAFLFVVLFLQRVGGLVLVAKIDERRRCLSSVLFVAGFFFRGEGIGEEARIADDREGPVEVLDDGHDDEIVTEDVDAAGPAFDALIGGELDFVFAVELCFVELGEEV